MSKNISAYTANKEPYPEFISVNRHEKGVSITVRAPVRCHGGNPAMGEMTEIIMTKDEFMNFISDAVYNFDVTFDDPNQRKLAL